MAKIVRHTPSSKEISHRHLTPKQRQEVLEFWRIEYNYKSYACEDVITKFIKQFRKYFDERSLWRWRSIYDGTLKSLRNKPRVDTVQHKNTHTEKEIQKIQELLQDKRMSLLEIHSILEEQFEYTRSYETMTSFIRRHNLREKQTYAKYEPQEYHTPLLAGYKWQMDIKYVPRVCNINVDIKHIKDTQQLYQYTMIDEATRKRFLWIAERKTAKNTCIFLVLAFMYFGYMPQEIQTDNGTEFTNRLLAKKSNKIHPVYRLLSKHGIIHHCIAPATPKHDGKVERSHLIDMKLFYSHIKYRDIDDLQIQVSLWNKRYNNIKKTVLRNASGKMLSPNQKESELLAEIEYLSALPQVDYFVTPSGIAQPQPILNLCNRNTFKSQIYKQEYWEAYNIYKSLKVA